MARAWVGYWHLDGEFCNHFSPIKRGEDGCREDSGVWWPVFYDTDEAEWERLHDACEFYADRTNWYRTNFKPDPAGSSWDEAAVKADNCGDRARAALRSKSADPLVSQEQE